MRVLLCATLSDAMGGEGGCKNSRAAAEDHDDDDNDNGEEVVSLLLPSLVLSEIREETRHVDDNDDEDGMIDDSTSSSFVNVEEAIEENDDGWMYANFGNESDDTCPGVVDLITRANEDRVPHLIWPTDSF